MMGYKTRREVYKTKLHALVNELMFEEEERCKGESSLDNVFFAAEKIMILKDEYDKEFSPTERLLSSVFNDE